jgi:hypothetical protein
MTGHRALPDRKDRQVSTEMTVHKALPDHKDRQVSTEMTVHKALPDRKGRLGHRGQLVQMVRQTRGHYWAMPEQHLQPTT